ncbi:YD repeat-containing protein [Mesonia phycicola]|uniref:YD repeat-containing protein n=1 Tax=Mesonia phycicola TaxID=579105 RepID=A0A1M6A797_9FLAO|nr:hypothetical protein [Mesonia phycicola]SHI32013.1 YD repeat-containing protein [Mesonia phycicola]
MKKNTIISGIILLFLFVSCLPKTNSGKVNNYNFPLFDNFDDTDEVSKEDYNLYGEVKKVTYYTKIPLANVNSTKKKNKSFEVNYDKEGRFMEKNIFYVGSFFFNGKVKRTTTVTYDSLGKVLVDKDMSKDSIEIVYRNKYDKNGNLLETESKRGARKYTYDDKDRVIKEEGYKKLGDTFNFNNPKELSTVYTYEYVDDYHKIKKKLKSNNFDTSYNEHYYYRKNGSLDSTQIATSQDTITTKYDENKNVIYYNKIYKGKDYYKKIYTFNQKKLLVEEKIYRKGEIYQNVTYTYDENRNLTNTKTCMSNRNCIETSFKYEYDNKHNWVKKESIQSMGDNKEVGYVEYRDIMYY